ncbi:transcriptional regulator TACO1-like protein [Polychytrium aggregatum]|uniref:transcriptional regulator TACO1-like protein n=1 Tax=Polychytrium aggregatum TaxID=110093 RepID=UPI0022FF340C|nr:transcriptional regulator TACO1-like protein [Polychytrium aggregatum]KAI9209510.1 transcriptional regulator TACO1-like protein [Polychytrium aggregatum]
MIAHRLAPLVSKPFQIAPHFLSPRLHASPFSSGTLPLCAGHNRWSKIGRQKGANDVARGKVISKLTRRIIAAVRNFNGDTDPRTNFELAAALNVARQLQLPRSTIDTSIKKGLGSDKDDEADLESIAYEGLGPAGVAVIVHTLTNNRNRSFQTVRLCFTENGGSLTPVAYLFQKRGRIVAAPGSTGHSLDDMCDSAIDCNVEDIGATDESDTSVELWCATNQLAQIRAALEAKGYEIRETEITYYSEDKIDVPDGEPSDQFQKLLDDLDNLEDVISIYTNAA